MVRVTATVIGLNPLSGRTALLIEPGYRVHNRILHVCDGPHFIERYGIFQMMQCKYLRNAKEIGVSVLAKFSFFIFRTDTRQITSRINQKLYQVTKTK